MRGEHRLDLRLGDPTAVTDPASTPHVFALAQSTPNPFNAATTIAFSLEAAGAARLVVYGLSGQRVRVLASGDRPAGPQRVVWDGTDDAGRPVASGVYLYRLATPTRQTSRKLLLLR